MRKGMWEVVTSRKHTVYKMFPYGPDAKEVMLYGKVQYGFKDGREVGVDWAARAELVKDSQGPGGWKFQYYQVYLVSRHLLWKVWSRRNKTANSCHRTLLP